MQKKNDRGTSVLRMLAAGATLAGLLAFAPRAEAQQAPARDSAHAEHRMRRGPGGPHQLDPAQRIARHLTLLTERLSLSEPQAAQVKAILTERHAQLQALHDEAGFRRPAPRAEGERPARPTEAEREAMRERMQALRTRMEAIHTRSEERLQAVLTEEQRAAYADLRARMKENARGFRGARGEGRPGRGR